MEKNKELLLKVYRNAVAIRAFEMAAHEQYANGLLAGSVHLYVGEEGIASGVCGVLNDNDYITSTHRGHGHLIAKGGDLKLMMAELAGKGTGYCKGKGDAWFPWPESGTPVCKADLIGIFLSVYAAP